MCLNYTRKSKQAVILPDIFTVVAENMLKTLHAVTDRFLNTNLCLKHNTVL